MKLEQLYLVMHEPKHPWRASWSVTLYHVHARSAAEALRYYRERVEQPETKYYKAPRAEQVMSGAVTRV